jgi:hypothetical protein
MHLVSICSGYAGIIHLAVTTEKYRTRLHRVRDGNLGKWTRGENDAWMKRK